MSSISTDIVEANAHATDETGERTNENAQSRTESIDDARRLFRVALPQLSWAVAFDVLHIVAKKGLNILFAVLARYVLCKVTQAQSFKENEYGSRNKGKREGNKDPIHVFHVYLVLVEIVK